MPNRDESLYVYKMFETDICRNFFSQYLRHLLNYVSTLTFPIKDLIIVFYIFLNIDKQYF